MPTRETVAVIDDVLERNRRTRALDEKLKPFMQKYLANHPNQQKHNLPLPT